MTPEEKKAAGKRILPILALLTHIKKQELEISRMLLEVARWEEEDVVAHVNRQMDRLAKVQGAFGIVEMNTHIDRIHDVLYDLSGDILLGKERQGFSMRHHHRRRREQER